MKKPLSVAEKLRRIEHRVPVYRDFSDAVMLAASLDPANLDDTDRDVTERIVRDLFEVLAEMPRERQELRELDRLMHALVPDFEPQREPVTDNCRHCDDLFQPRRSDARYCSTRCRVAAKRLRDRSQRAVTEDPEL